jgi:hypothetical protein
MNEIPNLCANIENGVTRIFLPASSGPEPVRLMYAYISVHKTEQRHLHIYRPTAIIAFYVPNKAVWTRPKSWE